MGISTGMDDSRPLFQGLWEPSACALPVPPCSAGRTSCFPKFWTVLVANRLGSGTRPSGERGGGGPGGGRGGGSSPRWAWAGRGSRPTGTRQQWPVVEGGGRNAAGESGGGGGGRGAGPGRSGSLTCPGSLHFLGERRRPQHLSPGARAEDGARHGLVEAPGESAVCGVQSGAGQAREGRSPAPARPAAA